jgi:FkbM family methyltransferase
MGRQLRVIGRAAGSKIPPLGWVLRGLRSIEIAPQKFLPISRRVDGFDWQYVYYSSLYRSEHESRVRKLALDKGGDCFFDIGANVGGWSLRATRSFHEVFAFEPQLWTAAILRRNVEKNRSRIDQTHQVHVFPCALGNENGRLSFFSDRKGDRGNGGASLTMMNPGHPYPGRRNVTVEVRRFDDLSLPCTHDSLIKIDTEGGEIAVLEGMEKTLGRFHPRLAVEAHGLENVGRCKRIFEEYGYRIQELALPGQSYFLAE